MRAPAVMAVLLLLPFAAGTAPAAGPLPGEMPFPPTDRSLILREEGAVYLVDGRVVIPKGVEISCQKDIHIRSRSKAPAILVVEGSFKAHGVSGREIIFENVLVEPGTSFDEIQLDTCIFRKGGGLATPKDGSAEGRILLQFVSFTDRSRCDVAMTGASFQMLDSNASTPPRLRGIPGKDGTNRLKAVVRGTSLQGIEAVGIGDLTVRLCKLRNVPLLFRDCAVLCFDGNKVEGKELLFEQTKAGGFANTRVMKCDLYSKVIAFRAPADPKRDDAVVLDKCWFEGIVDPKEIAGRIRDSSDDPANNVRATAQNPQERPLELAGSVNR